MRSPGGHDVAGSPRIRALNVRAVRVPLSDPHRTKPVNASGAVGF